MIQHVEHICNTYPKKSFDLDSISVNSLLQAGTNRHFFLADRGTFLHLSRAKIITFSSNPVKNWWHYHMPAAARAVSSTK